MGVVNMLTTNYLPQVGNTIIKGRKVRRGTKRPRAGDRFISVVIPAHNEEAYLRQTLDALNCQSHSRRELIVVANGCTDQTAEVARTRCDRVVVLSQRSLGVARNLGARMARGELLMFLDADTILEPHALSKVAETFSRKDAAGTLEGRPDSDRLAYWLIYCLKNFLHRRVLRNGSSGVIICWKKDFYRIGGFDEGLEVRENSELIRRLKCFGGYKYVADAVAVTSMRRYERRGIRRVAWLWIKLWFRSLFQDLHSHHYESVR